MRTAMLAGRAFSPAATALLFATRRPLRTSPWMGAVRPSGSIDDKLLNERMGLPMSPAVPASAALLRYFYEGSTLSQSRLCTLDPACGDAVMASEVLQALSDDGVDLGRFFACAYETAESGGSWLPMLRDVDLETDAPFDDVALPLVPPVDLMPPPLAPTLRAPRTRRRVDVKLFRRGEAEGGAQAGGTGRTRRGIKSRAASMDSARRCSCTWARWSFLVGAGCNSALRWWQVRRQVSASATVAPLLWLPRRFCCVGSKNR